LKNKPIVLIVDDLKDNRLAIKIALKNEKYELHEAINGQEAIVKCKELNPDVILMDAMMPVMDGYEATKTIRQIEEFNRTPILMITALNQKDDKIKAIEYGISDFITKPFGKHELIARCKSYVSLSQINKQYILSSIDPDTKLPNKSTLIDDIKTLKNPKLIVFRIEDYEILEEFYTEDVAVKIEYKFSKRILNLVTPTWKDAKLYHTSEGEFALLKDDTIDLITSEQALKDCAQFYENAKHSIISFDDYEYNISIVLSFASGKTNLFEHARVGLNHAIKEKEISIFANDIIEQVHKDAANNVNIIKVVKQALHTNNIVSYFQPILNNKTNEIDRYESLVRIIDDKGNILSPFFFLDIAKKGKYYTQITQKVIRNTLEALKTTDKEISINLSATDIENTYIREMIINYFQNNPKIASRVIFELLEDENVKDFNTIIDFITIVKSYGAKIAIDDFGAGYSNFSRLLDFAPDIIKLDGSLIKNIHIDKFSRNIVETMQAFASKMNIQTVAEFVHSQEVLDVINEIGIDYTQGYHISEPKATL
jgi:EAL domain-containing protein (putative c-di-GMP-specific phosphodiesterase class I)/CheY-like chemotaxis protein